MTALSSCTRVRRDLEPRRVEPDSFAPHRRRRRSLHLRARRWARDTVEAERAIGTVFLVALTVEDAEPLVAQGAIRQLLGRYSDLAGSGRYFWWAEFQKRGAIHYHAMLVDPPFRHVRDARAWLARHWSLAGIDPSVERRDGAWFRSTSVGYVIGDVGKIGDKLTQQDYRRMPRGWRVCGSNRLTWSVAQHEAHEPSLDVACAGDPALPWWVREREVWVVGEVLHVWPRDGCSLHCETPRPGRARPRTRVRLGCSLRLTSKPRPCTASSMRPHRRNGAGSSSEIANARSVDGDEALCRAGAEAGGGLCTPLTQPV
jgi:hypothetical protein